MSKSTHVFRIVAATLAVGVLLITLCVAAGIAIALDLISSPPGSATKTWIGCGSALGLLVGCSGILFAIQQGRTLQDCVDEMTRRVEIAGERIGCRVSREHADSKSFIPGLSQLLDALDRVIDERSQREREVFRSDQLAMVGQIAAGVAHEIRNPLTSIKLLIQTNLRESAQSAVPSNDLVIIDQEIRRMEKCLQQFLDFARPPRPERRPIELGLLAERTLALVDGRARKQRVTLAFRPAEIPVIVEADEDQIQQLLVNLVLNALDAMPEGGLIEIHLSPSVNGHAEVRVLDTGPGIPTELFPSLFDPFVSTKETGIGLGLAVSHRIAARHGGILSAENRETGGACFILRLPIFPTTAISNSSLAPSD